MRDLKAVSGGCHCKNIVYDLWWPGIIESTIDVRKCGCAFCQKHAGAWTSHPGGKLSVTVVDPGLITRYVFGTNTADFHVCSNCGVVPCIVSEIEGRKFAVVNVNTFENAEDLSFSCSATDFDGENTRERLNRRKQTWIPDVQIVEPVA